MRAAITLFALIAFAIVEANAGPLEDAISAENNHVTSLKQLAQKGNPKAQFELGVLFHLGWSTGKDDVEAAKWYRLAAEQGLDAAQNVLGFAYYSGEGVRQDYFEAAKWLKRAADQGFAVSQNRLGHMYE